MQQHEGFVALQVRFNGCATVTISKENPDEIREDLMALGLSREDANKILDDAGQRFLKALEEPKDKEGTDDNKPRSSNKPKAELGPKCGHGVRREKRQGRNGPFWSCVAKDENGDFLWKNKEGCAIVDFDEGIKLMKEQGLA